MSCYWDPFPLKHKKVLLVGLGLYAFCILHISNKTTFRVSFRAHPINNEMCTSLLIKFTLSESSNVVLFYVCNMQNAYNLRPRH
jgi:hypothetical protein